MIFSLMWFHLFIFAVVARAFSVTFIKSLPRPMPRRFFPMFSGSFVVSGLPFKSLLSGVK